MQRINDLEVPRLDKREDELWEEYYIKKLEDALIPWETNFYLKELKELAKLSKKPSYVSKIKRCLNIVQNPHKDIKIREIIVKKMGTDFIPSIDGEELSEKNITEISNQLGEIMDRHRQDDSFKETCASAFIETIILYEKD